jgi:hypothetical protein
VEIRASGTARLFAHSIRLGSERTLLLALLLSRVSVSAVETTRTGKMKKLLFTAAVALVLATSH